MDIIQQTNINKKNNENCQTCLSYKAKIAKLQELTNFDDKKCNLIKKIQQLEQQLQVQKKKYDVTYSYNNVILNGVPNNQLPTTVVNHRCWYDHHPINNIPFYLPESYDMKTDTFNIIGIFCNPSCALTYAINNKGFNIGKMRSLIMNLYRRISNIGEDQDIIISIMPPITKLIEYGGDLTIEEFRSYNGINKVFTEYYPICKPLTRTIEEKIYPIEMEEKTTFVPMTIPNTQIPNANNTNNILDSTANSNVSSNSSSQSSTQTASTINNKQLNKLLTATSVNKKKENKAPPGNPRSFLRFVKEK